MIFGDKRCYVNYLYYHMACSCFQFKSAGRNLSAKSTEAHLVPMQPMTENSFGLISPSMEVQMN